MHFKQYFLAFFKAYKIDFDDEDSFLWILMDFSAAQKNSFCKPTENTPLSAVITILFHCRSAQSFCGLLTGREQQAVKATGKMRKRPKCRIMSYGLKFPYHRAFDNFCSSLATMNETFSSSMLMAVCAQRANCANTNEYPERSGTRFTSKVTVEHPIYMKCLQHQTNEENSGVEPCADDGNPTLAVTSVYQQMIMQ
ncbi:hypothetical protein VTP01DRAFT_620 [Rhizomucor pusillus]|uniref:uncharacterized protein n=1 Tax=Rhizomucor pusillus TaxID=4840 RepID=UPI0037429D9E